MVCSLQASEEGRVPVAGMAVDDATHTISLLGLGTNCSA